MVSYNRMCTTFSPYCMVDYFLSAFIVNVLFLCTLPSVVVGMFVLLLAIFGIMARPPTLEVS